MEVGEKKTLKKRIGWKNQTWVPAGEEVKIISVSGNAVIVETKKGAKFPANIKDFE